MRAQVDNLRSPLRLGYEWPLPRHRRMRRAVKHADIYRWLDSFLRAAVSRQLSDFPVVEEYLPAAQAEAVPDEASK